MQGISGDQGTAVRENAPDRKPDHGDAARQAAFRRAMNHSRRVRALKLALRVGGKRRLRNIGPRQWAQLGRALGLDPALVLERVTALARALPDHAASALRACRDDGLHHSVLKRLVAAIRERSQAWLRVARAA